MNTLDEYIKIPPPKLDEFNEASDMEEWKKWWSEIDYFMVDWSLKLQDKKTMHLCYGHRGVRIVERDSPTGTWAYNVTMGLKKK